MKLSSLQLENYRCFTEFKLTFDKQLTVLVGINGSGKTAVLDAVAVFLKHYAENYCHYPDISSMPETDIHFDKDMANLVFTAENFQKNINENIPLKISFTAKKM